MATPSIRGPRYLARFTCIAERCEDTCCHGWNVAVDGPTLARWQAALPADRVASALTPDRRALRLLDDGACPMLDRDRLCAVQRTLGAEALADTCALFPRVLQTVGDQREVTATLACPELARRSLLTADGHELVELAPALVLDRTPHTAVEVWAGQHPWVAAGARLRDALDRGLADPTWPVATRLFAVADLGLRSRPYFHPDTTPPLAQTGGEPRIVVDALATFTPATLGALHDELTGDAPVAFAALAIVLDVLAARLATPTSPRLHALIEAALAGCDAADGAVAGAGRRWSPAQLWELHGARVDAWPPTTSARVDAIDAAWARHFWRHRWHLFATDLFAHGLLHLVSRAVGRVLLAAHPRVATDVDGAAVETIYLYTRHLEHGGLYRQLAQRLRAGGLETRAIARSLLLL